MYYFFSLLCKTINYYYQKICIINCGELKRGENWNLEENDGSEDIYTPWPEDWDYALCTDKLTVSIYFI